MENQNTIAADLSTTEALSQFLSVHLDDNDPPSKTICDVILSANLDSALTSGALDSIADQLLSIIGPASED